MIAGSGGDVSATRGLHSGDAELVWRRLLRLQTAPISLMLRELPPVVASRAVARLNRYGFLAESFGRDPDLAAALPAHMTRTGRSGRFVLTPAELRSVAALALRHRPDSFSAGALSAAETLPEREGAALVALLWERQELLPAESRLAALALARERLPASSLEAADDRLRRLYERWPKGELRVAVVMTQEPSAAGFASALRLRGYRPVAAREDEGERRPDVSLVRPSAGRSTRVDIFRFASNKDGWVEDKPGMSAAMSGLLADPRHQVVVYRGHLGDYEAWRLGETRAQAKLFMDLACDSERKAEAVLQSCVDCAFLGTTVTARGAANDAVLRRLIDALARREPGPEIGAELARSLPATSHGFFGSFLSPYDLERHLK